MWKKIYIDRFFVEYLLAFILFMQCNTCYFFIISEVLTKGIELFVVFLTFFLCFLEKSNLSRKWTLLFIVSYALFIIPLFLNSYLSSTHIGFCFRFGLILPMFIVYFGSIDNDRHNYCSLFYKFSDITFFFACISLFFWLICEVCGFIDKSGAVLIEWGEVQYYGHNFYLHFHGQGIRNCGVFTEGPMYNIVLCTSLCVELFLKKEVHKTRVIIYVLTILSTGTTTGQLMLLLLGSIFLSNKQLNYSAIVRVLLYVVMFILSLVCLIVGLYVFIEKMDGPSFFVRMHYILEELQAWCSSPLFGMGYSTHVEGSSNSSSLLLAEGGIWVYFFYLLCLICIPFKKRDEHRGLFLFSGIYFLMLSITLVPYTSLTFAILALGLGRVLHVKSVSDYN